MNNALEQMESTLLATLRQQVRGRVITAADAAYEAARLPYITGFDDRPVAVVRPADAADVARVVLLARDAGQELAVRSGGHSVAGHSTCSGVVLDLSSMKALDIDVAGRTAWAETGLTAGEYTAATGEHGLATGFGDAPSVGIGGITLGGGVGFLHRHHGLTIDNVLAAEVVTADGELVHADATSHPDLFWAIRGGGGNFGVVTRFKYRLAEVSDVVGGMLLLPATPDVITAFIAAADSAPEQLSSMINIMPAPPMPGFPPELVGRLVIMGLFVYDGPAADAEAALAPFRALATPVVDTVAPIRYPQMYEGHGEPPHPAGMAVRSFFRDTISPDLGHVIADGLQRSGAMMRVVQIRALGGAVDRVPGDATAWAHRGRRMLGVVAAMYQDRAEADAHHAWAAGLAEELGDGRPGAYVAFLSESSGDLVRRSYQGAHYDRLCAVKNRYDPGNVFRLNQNIQPAR